jgi:hypothetical protein
MIAADSSLISMGADLGNEGHIASAQQLNRGNRLLPWRRYVKVQGPVFVLVWRLDLAIELLHID